MSTPAHRLYEMGEARKRREAKQQTAEDIKFVLDGWFKDGKYENTEEARSILAAGIREWFDGFYSFENLNKIAAQTHLDRKMTKQQPHGREVSATELEDWIKRVLATNQWIATTHRNIDIISKIFLFDARINRKRQLSDLVEAVKIAEAEHRLDRTPPTPKPKFQDIDLTKPLTDGTMPLPLEAPDAKLRRSTKAQVQDIVNRRLARDKWRKENPQ